jgi:hypothetical protein
MSKKSIFDTILPLTISILLNIVAQINWLAMFTCVKATLCAGPDFFFCRNTDSRHLKEYSVQGSVYQEIQSPTE